MVRLQKWFMAIGIMVNAIKSAASPELARGLDMNQKSAWYMQQRIRAATPGDPTPMLQGIFEADETYVGGKPHKGNKREDDGDSAPSGRGTKYVPVVGAVERYDKVAARVAHSVSGKALVRFLQEAVDPLGTLLITDEWKGYNTARAHHQYVVVCHSRAYVEDLLHGNTFEGFWSLLKRAWYGTHHHYACHCILRSVAGAASKYNHRQTDNAFGAFMREVFA